MTPYKLPGLEVPAAMRVQPKQDHIGNFPVEVDPDLVAELIRRFPNTCPDPGEGALAEVYQRHGQQQVIRMLRAVSAAQHPRPSHV